MENMIYYHCRKAIRGENKATPYSQKDVDIRQLSLFMADPIFSGDRTQYFRTLGALYAGVVTEFTRKKLSFPLDILDAFSGISSAMEKLCSWRMVAGIPENILEYALLWSTGQSVARRPQNAGNSFPSWSWAGWHPEVDYDKIFRTEQNFEPYLAKLESLIRDLEIHDQQGTRSIQSLVPANEQIKSTARKSRPAATTECGNTIGKSRLPNIVLQFQALAIPCTSLEIISKRTLDPVVNVARPNLAPIQRTVIDIFLPGRLRFCGVLVSTNPATSSTTHLQSCDLIFLSGCQSDENESTASFTNFMLVQWTGGFAERVAIGVLEGVMGTDRRLEDRFGDRFTTANVIYFLGGYPVTDCFWKTIMLI